MAKQSRKQDPQESVRRDLVGAQLALQTAQEKQTEASERGKQHVEQARQQAAKWLTKASQRVERRARAVAKAEARLRELSLPPPPHPPATIDIPEERVVSSLEPVMAETVPSDDHGLRDRELQALQALRRVDRPDGISATEWRQAAEQSETTLTRARDALIERGLVARYGPAGQGARYGLTEAGRMLVQ